MENLWGQCHKLVDYKNKKGQDDVGGRACSNRPSTSLCKEKIKLDHALIEEDND